MASINQLPSFPVFKKIELTDYPAFKQFTSQFSPYSDYNFVSLWSYNVEDDCLISNLNGNLVIRFRDYITNKPFLSFFGTKKVHETIHTLLQFADNEDLETSIKLIPETVLKKDKKLLKQSFHFETDRDNFDYVYHLVQISELKGDAYSKKKNRVNHFLKNYPEHQVIEIDLNDKNNHSALLEVFKNWETSKNAKETDHEFRALSRLLMSAESFHLFCVGIYIDGVLRAFTIGEVLHRKFAISHFTKADYNFNGIFEYLYKVNADKLLTQGALYYNREQDMGLEGLRIAKLSWRPKRFLKKYQIKPKLPAN